ncbi:MAG TPA: tripartite tricarboxylate transporter substrate binding protein [Thermodesulfobacteriota bacterium]|nr:tripartite tricarboxylate transporter substrate binding protein [Thermodesulfobacteriota bacterium]
MRTKGKKVLIILSVITIVSLNEFSDPAYAQTSFPTKPISMIVPFAPGGAVDTTIRIISEEAEKLLGQKILVINKPGAGAAEGQGFVARSKPDGYTLLAITSSVVTNTLTKKVDFSVDSFDPIVLYCFDPEVMFVSSTSPYQTLEELINAARKESVSHATPGHSTSHHVAGLILEKKIGVKFKFVHTKGAGEQVPMVAGGHAKCMLASWGEARSMVEQGRLRVLGVMSQERDPRLPNMPTFKERGYPIEYGAWRGIAGPQKTPPEVLGKLVRVFKGALDKKEVKEKFAKAEYPIMAKGPKDFEAYIRSDYGDVKQILSMLK